MSESNNGDPRFLQLVKLTAGELVLMVFERERQLAEAQKALLWCWEHHERSGHDVDEEIIRQVAIAGAARAAAGEKP